MAISFIRSANFSLRETVEGKKANWIFPLVPALCAGMPLSTLLRR
jgi:hypothetical protein